MRLGFDQTYKKFTKFHVTWMDGQLQMNSLMTTFTRLVLIRAIFQVMQNKPVLPENSIAAPNTKVKTSRFSKFFRCLINFIAQDVSETNFPSLHPTILVNNAIQ